MILKMRRVSDMRRIFLAAAVLAAAVSCSSQFSAETALTGGVQALQAATLTNSQVQGYVKQYITDLDSKSDVLPESSPYVKRLRRITAGLTSVNGTPLNFKVYKTDELNAFACADGSVRVYTGLMDAMSDDEILGVIGHEIGHVALEHSKRQFQQALLTSAVRNGIASGGGTVGALTASELGALGESLVGAKFSRKQESEADDYGYDFLKKNGKNPWAMAMAFEELAALSGESSGSEAGNSAAGSSVNQLFSSHPATADRVRKMAERAAKDGFKRPEK